MLALVNQELFTTLEIAADADPRVQVAILRAAVERVASREKVASAATAVTELVPDDAGGADSA